MAKVNREEIFAKLVGFLENYTNFPKESLSENTTLCELGLDSLDALEVSMDLEMEYDIDIADMKIDKFQYLKDIVDCTEELVGDK